MSTAEPPRKGSRTKVADENQTAVDADEAELWSALRAAVEDRSLVVAAALLQDLLSRRDARKARAAAIDLDEARKRRR